KAKLDPSFIHSWVGMAHANTNRLGVEWFGLAIGLGFVLSFGYLCSDFLPLQRAMAANSMSAARRTPLIGAIPKMLFPFLVILPGLIAIALPNQMAQHSANAVAMSGPEASIENREQGKGLIPYKVDASTGKPS